MKKGIIAALLASMVLSMSACGSGSSEAENTVTAVDAEKIREEAEAEMKARHQERTESSERVETEEEDGNGDDTDRRDKASMREESQEEEKNRKAGESSRTDDGNDSSDEEEDAAEDGYVRGTIEGATYESEWIGFRYELPDGFRMSDEDEMDAILQAGGELIYEGNADNIVDYAKMIMVYEMMAKDRYGDVITLFVEKTQFDIDTYVAAIKMQMGNVDTIGVTMDDGETVEVGGVEFEKYSLVLDYGGMEVKEDYYLKKQGDRMICMLIGYSDDEMAEKIMSGFSPY